MPSMLAQRWLEIAALGLLLLLVCSSELAGGEPFAETEEGVVLLELFTSQGCSSCPPADRLLRQLGEEPGIVALSLHVDYWNRLGWKDPFSAAAFSQRQSRYARALKERGVYTPQVVVDGRMHLVGSDEGELRTAIAERRTASPNARLQIELSREEVFLDARILEPPTAELEVVAAIYEKGLVTPVARGENGGRTLRNDYVVRRLWTAGTIPQRATGIHRYRLDIPIDVEKTEGSRRLGVAVFLQDPESMEVYAATATPLSALSR